jgi:AAA15 family ATPase/GTPase
MLVEFKVGNYRSFREEQTLSLVARKDKSLINNVVDKNDMRLLKAVSIYGPNASGKSNFIKAMDVMKSIILSSAEFQPGKKLPIQSFIFDSKYQEKPSTFEVTFYHNNIRYQYGFAATSEKIHDEWLFAYPNGRLQVWYERSSKGNNWKFGSFLKGEKEKLKEKTRDNVLFLSVGAQWNNKQLTTIYEWFRYHLQTIPSNVTLLPITAKMLLETETDKRFNKLFYEYVKSCLKDADLGILGLKVNREKVNESKVLKDIPESLKDTLLAYLKETEGIKVELLHKNPETGNDIFLPIQEESDGTKRFFELAGPWFQAIMVGITIFIDELDVSLHPLLTRELIKFIQHPKHKDSEAQLIFTTHDTTLLDPELLRRDQIWLTEKKEIGSSKLFPMSDFKPRQGEAMQKGYLAGRYGAIPIIEEFSLNGKQKTTKN